MSLLSDSQSYELQSKTPDKEQTSGAISPKHYSVRLSQGELADVQWPAQTDHDVWPHVSLNGV